MFKNSFQKLSFLQKVELYLLAIIFYGSIVWFYDDIFKSNISIKDDNVIVKKYEKDIDKLKSKIIKKDKTWIISFIENSIKKYNLFSNSLEFRDNQIQLSFYGKFTDIVNMLNNLQLHIDIIEFSLSKYDNNQIICNIKLDSKYFFNEEKTTKVIKNISNVFQVKKEQIFTKKDKKFQISAIVLNEVLIDEKWYKVNDKIGEYKIKTISDNFIDIINLETNISQVLKVHNE